MPLCSVLECRNDSRRRNITNGGVSYHRFPKDTNLKEIWIDATGKINWVPKKSSTICSAHFLEDDFLISSKGNRYLKPTAFPSLNIVIFLKKTQNINNANHLNSECTESIQLKHETQIDGDLEDTKSKFYEVLVGAKEDIVQIQDDDTGSSSNCTTPTQQDVNGQLRFYVNKIRNQSLKIKRLQSGNRRLREKNNKLTEKLRSLEEKCIMVQEFGKDVRIIDDS